ncbi:MAG TPA: PAS domain S-box protein, partial [Blastocatellia bacterium]
MLKERRSAWWRYGGAIVMTGIAAVLRWAFNPLLGNAAPFALFVMAVTVTALFYGLGPALLAAFVGGLIALFAWLLPGHPPQSTVLTNSIVYLALTVFISILIELMRRARQRAEENTGEANESRKLLATTLGSIGDAVIATDVEARVTFMNPVAESLTGWTRAEALGQPIDAIFVIINEYSRQPVENPVARVLREGIIVGLANHTVLIQKQGTEIPIDDSGAPIRDEQGNVSGVVLVFRDVSERHKAEAALAFVASIVESSDDAIIGKTLDGIILSWNQGAERLYGYRAEEVIGKHIRLLTEPEHDDVEAILEQLKNGKSIDHYETVRVKKNGERVSVALTISPIKDLEGRLTGASTIARDITERKHAEAERARLLAEAETREQRARFLAEASAALASSLDYEVTLRRVAELAVPQLADWCAV